MRSLSEKAKERQIRVFISSTFHDMQAEREELIKRVFPHLRKLCEQRGVVWGEVDLRWGVTDEQKAEGKVLPICLAEINNCRPYFIGLLGECYGWVPDAIPPELIEQEPWLKEHLTCSITELEILHGVLNNPQMADHAFFYFRDPLYIDIFPESQRKAYREVPVLDAIKRLGHEKAKERVAYRKRMLAHLKDRIRESGLPVRENYQNTKDLGHLVFKDMLDVINRLYPEEQRPDSLEREEVEHATFALNRAKVYIKREEDFKRLDTHVLGDGPPLVILGKPGSGKSALLANWALRCHKEHPQAPLLIHFIGATSYSSDWGAMIRRILGELKRRFGIDKEIPTKKGELQSALDEWFPYVPAAGRCIIILDGLNQLEARDNALDLFWLPKVIPRQIRLIVSTLPGPPLKAIKKRGWPCLEVELLTEKERHRLIVDYLKQYRKVMSPKRIHHIVSVEASANPLYLSVLLEELRVFGSHERLETQINNYLSAPTIDKLYERILDRWERDYEQECPGLVSRVFSFIWAARRGLSETELLDLLGGAEGPLPQAQWSPLFLAAEHALGRYSGRISFFHDYLRKAIEHRYLFHKREQQAVHLSLADYFASHVRSERQLEELPWQIQHTDNWQRLKEYLTDIPTFEALHEKDEYDLLGYWLAIGDRYDMEAAYKESLEAWEKCEEDAHHLASTFIKLAGFFQEAGHIQGAEPLYRRGLAILEEILGPRHPDVATSLNNLAQLLNKECKYEEAEQLYHRALIIYEDTLDLKHPDVAKTLNNFARMLHAKGEYQEAEIIIQRALVINKEALGPLHPDVAKSLNTLALLLKDKGEYRGAELFHRQAIAILEETFGLRHPRMIWALNDLALLLHTKGEYREAESLFRRALVSAEETLGPKHIAVGTYLNNLALLLKDKGEYREAESLFRRALVIAEETYGPKHREVAGTLSNLALLLCVKGEYGKTDPLLRRALVIMEEILGEKHPDVANSLSLLSELFKIKGSYEEAERLQSRALAIREEIFGPKHPDVAISLDKLAELLYIRGEYGKAEPLYRRALAIREEIFGPKHPKVASSLNNLALLLKDKGEYGEAEPLYRRALEIREETFGLKHPDVALSLSSLAGLLYAKGEYGEAESLYRQVLAIYEGAFGPNHLDVAISLNNLALLLYTRGEYRKAEPLYRRALAIREEILGLKHLDVALSFNNLALLLKDKGDYGEAEPLLRQALAIREELLGPKNSDLANSLSSLAVLLYAKGEYGEAEPLLRRALAIRGELLGPKHPAVAISLNNLAQLLKVKGDYGEAECLYRQALKIFEDALGLNHPHVAYSLMNLAYLLQGKGDYNEAAKIFTYLLERFEQKEVTDSTLLNRIAICHNELACYTEVPAKNWQKAEFHYRKAIKIFKKVSRQVDAADAELNLQTIFWLLGQKIDTTKVKELIEILEKAGDNRAKKGYKLLNSNILDNRNRFFIGERKDRKNIISSIKSQIEDGIELHILRIIKSHQNYTGFAIERARKITKSLLMTLLSSDILNFTKKAIEEELLKSLIDAQHHWQTYQIDNFFLIISTIPVLSPLEARAYFQGKYLEFLNKQIQIKGIELGNVNFTHWICCSNGNKISISLTFLPTTVKAISVWAIDLLTETEKLELKLNC